MNKKIVIASLVLTASLSAGIVDARENEIRGKQAEIRAGLEIQNENPNDRQKEKIQQMQAKRLEFQDKKEKMTQDKCKNIETKISTRVGRYENNRQMLEKVYGNMQTRLTRLVAKLDAAGADTTKLKTDFATLNIKIEKLKADHTTFMTTLKDSQTFVCGKTESEFKNKLEQARKVPEIIKQDRADIKNFFNTTIKADLQAIRTQLAAQNPTKEATKDVDKTKTTTEATTPTPATTSTPTL